MSYNPFFETPLQRALREEQEKKAREQSILGAVLMTGILAAAAVNSRKSLLSERLYQKEVFVSFDYENDKRYKFMLEAWHANPKFKFTFRDRTSGEIFSDNVGYVKTQLTEKIKTATHTLVIVGQYANSLHKDYKAIGCRNWINFEIRQSKLHQKKIVAVKLDPSYTSPEELLNAGASWAMSFTEDAIIKALEKA